MRNHLMLLLSLSACVTEEDPLTRAAFEAEDLDVSALPTGIEAPPVAAASLELADGNLAPRVFLSGASILIEAPIVGGRPSIARARCVWQFLTQAVSVPANPPPGATWAFTVAYTPDQDLLLLQRGVPSVCTPAVFPAGPGLGFTASYALDASTNTVLVETPAGWVPHAPSRLPAAAAPRTFEWTAVLHTWP